MSDDRVDTGCGSLRAPEGWELRRELALLAPQANVEAPLIGGERTRPAPRANLVLDERAMETETPLEEIALIRDNALAGLPAASATDPEAMSLDDGREGLRFDVHFVYDGIAMEQRHVMLAPSATRRIVHFAITTRAGDTPQRDALERAMSSFEAT